MTDTAGTGLDSTGLDSTCAGCGNPLQAGASCEAGCPDRRPTASEEQGAGSPST